MPHTTRDILFSLRHRQRSDGFGLATAYSWLKSVQPCFSGGLCPEHVWSLATPERWSKALKHSKKLLTYSDAETFDIDFITKSINEGTAIAPGAILEYDTVLSSATRDRDGDVVEQSGLELDPRMPLLTHHVPMQPIGKMCKVLSQDEKKTIVRNAIADTSLGSDAAILVKFGALRTSMGFKPSDFIPLGVTKAADGRDIATGWHIKRARVYENSLVSIPANPDSNILSFNDGMALAYSQKKLATPFFKSLCRQHFDLRPTTVKVGLDLKAEDNMPHDCTCQKSTEASAAVAAEAEAPSGGKGCGAELGGKCKKCGKAMKDGKCACMAIEKGDGAAAPEAEISSLAALATKSIEIVKAAESLATKAVGEDSYYLPGSYEWVSEKLRPLAKKYLAGNGVDVDEDCWSSVIATFEKSAIVSCRSYRNDKSQCYRVGWEMDGDEPKFVGEPEEVKVTTVVVTKGLRLDHPDGPRAIKALGSELVRQAALADGNESVAALESVTKNLSDLLEIHQPAEVDEFSALLAL